MPSGWSNDQHIAHNAPAYTYVLWDAEGRALWVGATSRLAQRLKEHRRTSWGGEIVTQTVTEHPSRRAAFAAECDLLREHKPLHNRKGVLWNVGSTKGPTLPDPIPLDEVGP